MADMHDKEEGNNCQGGAGGTLDIQEFDSMQLFQEAQKVNQIRAQFKTEIAQMKQEIMDKSKNDLEVAKEQLKDDIMEEVMEDMKKLLKKEMGDDKQILRRMRLCFLPDKKVSKSTQVEDADFPEEEDEEDEEEEDMDGDISDDSQESVSLLAEAKKHRYM